jgi:hypothetical protein
VEAPRAVAPAGGDASIVVKHCATRSWRFSRALPSTSSSSVIMSYAAARRPLDRGDGDHLDAPAIGDGGIRSRLSSSPYLAWLRRAVLPTFPGFRVSARAFDHRLRPQVRPCLSGRRLGDLARPGCAAAGLGVPDPPPECPDAARVDADAPRALVKRRWLATERGSDQRDHAADEQPEPDHPSADHRDRAAAARHPRLEAVDSVLCARGCEDVPE